MIARGGATKAVQHFLAAVHAGDRATFEALIDRPALRSDLREQVMELGRSNGVEVDGGATDYVLDRRITPQAFRLVSAGGGQPLATAPDAGQIKPLVRMAGTRHACVAAADKAAPCVLSFAREKDGRWRLVGMRADQLTLAVDPGVTK